MLWSASNACERTISIGTRTSYIRAFCSVKSKTSDVLLTCFVFFHFSKVGSEV